MTKWIFLILFGCTGASHAADTLSVPCEVVKGLVYLQTTINGSAPLPFVLDTGASYTVLSPDTAKKLGVQPTGRTPSAGPGRGGDATMATASGVTLGIGGAIFPNREVAILPVDYIAKQGGHPTDGILSMSEFADRLVQVDYAGRCVRFLPRAAFVPSPADREVSLKLEDNVPYVEAGVVLPDHTVVNGRFILDSGFVGTLMFGMPFQRRHPELGQIKGRIALPPVQAVGGTMRLEAAIIPAVTLGTLTLEHPIAVISLNGAGVLDDPKIDGIIGDEVLSQYRVTYDYTNRRLLLSPPSSK